MHFPNLESNVTLPSWIPAPRLKSPAAPLGLAFHFFNFSQGSAALHPGLTSVAPPGLHALPKPKVQCDFAIMDTGSPGSNPLPPLRGLGSISLTFPGVPLHFTLG